MTSPVRSVDRALDILLCFAGDESALSMTQIAARAGIHKSTVHRLLATLEARGFLVRDQGNGHYRLGFRLVELASVALREIDLPRVAEPHMQRLAAECGETIDLGALDGDHVVYLKVIESPQRLKIAAAVGQRLPAYCTATGKAILAFLPPEQLEPILAADLPRYTELTKVTRADLERDLLATREQGYAVSEQEFEPDINALGAPILDDRGLPLGALAIVGPSFRLTRDRMLGLSRALLAATQAISRELARSSLSGAPGGLARGQSQTREASA